MKKFLSFLSGLLFAATSLIAQTTVFQEDFEPPSNANNVVASGATYNWSINTRLHNSGTQCDSNIVTANDTAYLTTLPFSTVGYTHVLLNFSHICKIEFNDKATIEVSIDGGVNWIKLTTEYLGSAQFSTQSYSFTANAYPEWLFNISDAKPQQSWWRNELFDISGFAAGKADVRVRFALKDGDNDGAAQNHGWYIDDVIVIAGTSELIPPEITILPPVIQDTITSTGPYDIYAWITDPSGIDTAYITYNVNSGPDLYIPMVWVSDSTYKGTIPSYTYNNRIDYKVYAADNSTSHNSIYETSLWFYIIKPGFDIIVGTGASTSNNNGPFYNLFENNRTQILYKASEINYAGNISHLAFNLSNIPADVAKRHLLNFTIKIKTTTLTTFGTAYQDMSTAITVFSSTDNYQMSSTGWYTFDITNFPYDGTSNLIVEVLWGDNAGTYSYSPYNVYRTDYSAGSDYLVVYGYADTETPPNYDGRSKIRPNIKFTFPGIANPKTEEAGVTQIIEPNGTITAGVNMPVNVTIKNYAGDTLKKVNIAWELDGVLQTHFAWTGELLEDVTSQPFTIGTLNVLPGPHNLRAWTEMPNDSIDQNPANDTASTSFYACTSPLGGTYTVGGAGADFETFADVQTALNNCGVNAPTVFKINNGEYIEQLTFNVINGASATNTVTFRPNDNATVTIRKKSINSTIKFNGTDYIILDGSNNGTTTRDMYIINDSTASNTAAIWIASLGTGQGCVGVTIKNCNISAGIASTTTNFGIYAAGTSISSSGTGNDHNLLSLINNNIYKAYYGIYIKATSGGVNDILTITGNTIGSENATEYITKYGINIAYADNSLISKNIIKNIVSDNSNLFGIAVEDGVTNTLFTKNNIYNIKYTGTYGYGGKGIDFSSGAAADANVTIANNFISQMLGDGYSGSSDINVGIKINGGSGYKIYYNSINLTGAANRSTATVSAAIYIASAVTSLDIRNNIFLNAITNNLSTLDKAYAIYSEATNTAFTNINYNDYFAPTGGDYAGVLGYLTSDRTTLAAWQTATAQDLNSVSANPDFFTDTDLHCFSLAVNELATPIAAVTDDFDGEPRNGTTPDIGADEFTVIDYNIAVLAVLQPVSDCGLSANENVVIRVKNVGLQPFSTAELYYKVNNGTPVHETMNQLINPGQTYDYTFTQQANLSLVGDYTFKVYASLTGDTVYFNDTINNYTINTGHVFANGPYTMGFEPTDDMLQWTKLDVNGDNYTWIFPYNGYAHTGSNCAELYNSSSVVADEWLFSRCFTMTAGATYKIEFWYQAESSYYPQNIDLKVGNSATPAAMTTNLLALASFTNTTYQKASVTFVPPTTGAYYFGWWGHSPDDYYFAYIDDINISLVPDQEAAIVEVIAPVSGCELTATENVIIKIKNEGALAINGNLTATYILNNGTPVTEPVAANILPGETYDFTFTQQVDLSVIGDYTFDFYVSYLGDTVQENDSLNNYTINTGHDFYSGAYTMGFEPTDDMSQWSMLDVNADGSSWTFPYSSSTYAHSGDNMAFYEYDYYNPGDDWLFSRCFKLNAGSTYKIEYWYGSFDADYAESLDLKVGNAATPEAMTTPLVSMPAITNTTYQKASVTYTPSTTDNYYFGWYAYSAADAYYIAVDDINISLVPDQEAALISIDAPESGCGLSGTEPVTIKIANTGVDTITGNLNAYYQFNGGTVVMEPVSDTILAGDTLTFSFSQTVDAYVTDTNIEFPIQAWIVLTGDPFQYNDSLAKDIISLYVPAPPVTINDTTVYATPATLQAIAADSVYWYNVPTGGTSIATGSVFVTPPLFVETIYYAEASTGSGLNMTEPFDGATFPAGWSTVEEGSDYIEIVTTSSAGGTPNEAKITGSSFSNVTDILYYGPINTTGNNSLTLQWNNYMSHYSSYYPYSISVQTSTDLVTWHNTSWVVNPVTSDIDPGIQTLTINTQDVGSPTFYLAFTMSGETFGAYGWYIDDVILSGASGCPSARVPDTAFIELYPWEASIVSLPSPVTKCTEGIEDVTIRIRNNGFEIIDSLGAICTVNGVPLVSEIITDTILPGDTLTYTFSAPLIAGLTSANQDSVYNIIAYVGLIGDLFSFNDTITNLVTLLYTPPSPVVSNITVPYGTAGTFAPVSSDTLNWYDVPTGGTQIAQGATFTTPILYGTTVYYVEAISGIADIKLTEITHYRTGTGATSSYPFWCTGEDLIEISNLGTAPVNLENYTMNIYGVGNRSYIIPQVTLNGGEVMILCVGSGVDDPANRYYNIGGSDDVIQSGSLSGFALKNSSGTVVDAVSSNGYAFTPADGVDATEWSGTISSMSGLAGSIRVISDNNVAADWIVSSAVNTQTIGAINPALATSFEGSGCSSARLADTAFVTGVPACDVSIQQIYTPNTGIELSATEPVTVLVKNYGTAPASQIPVHYTVNGGAPVNDTVPGPIASNDTVSFTFAQPADLSVLGTYNITAYTDLSCDGTLVNDTIHKTVNSNPLVYCTSNSTSPSSYEDIGNVTISNINNGIASPITYNTNAIYGYSDFTTSLPPVQLMVGATYPISVTVISATSFWSTYVKVFIDYNRDGVFDPATETAFGRQTTSSPLQPTAAGYITVPLTAVTDMPTRMRVVAKETTTPSSVLPCGTYTWGETEDYTVIIAPQIPNDAGAIDILSPLATHIEGESVPVNVLIKNFGSDTISNTSNMLVSFSHNGGIPQTINWSGGDIMTVMTDTAFLPNITITANDNTVCAWTTLPGDSNTFNDTVCKTIHGTPLFDATVTEFLHPGTQLFAGASDSVRITVKNVGADTLTAFNIVYAVEGVVQATQPWTGTLLPNATVNLKFSQLFTVPSSSFTICAYTSMGTDANHENDTLCMESYGVFLSTLPYYDNFDGTDINWSEVSTATSVWELGMPGYGLTNTAHSNPNAWDINLSSAYGTSANSMLYTQFFDFSGVTDAKMRFWLNYYTENSYDGIRIDYSIDNGTTWNVLGVENDTLGVNWYNDDDISSSEMPGWTNNSGGWMQCEYKLSAFNNLPAVRFRFVFNSDGSVTRDGVSVDDFAITVPSPIDAGVNTIISPLTQAVAGSSKFVQVRIKNYGTNTLYSIPVSYRVNLSGTPVTQTWTGTLLPEDTVTVTFTAPLVIPSGAFSLYSYTGLTGDGDHYNDTTIVELIGVPTFNVPYSDNFEGNVYWYGQGPSGLWEWGVPSATTINSAYSPTHAWATNLEGNYTNSATEYLYSPYFKFTSVDSAYLEFYHWYHTEGASDGGRIEYSINNGTWNILGAVGAANSVNWYNTTIGGFPCWAGNSNGYIYSKFRLTNIPAIVNTSYPVQFRYKFFSDASVNTYDGWAVDNFAITVPPIPKDAGVSAIVQPSAATQTGSQVTVEVTIKNYGTDSLQTVPLRYRVNNGPLVVGHWSGVLLPGATVNYTFPATYTSPGTTYNLCAFSVKSTDIYKFNDTTCTTISTTPASHDVGISQILSPGLITIYGSADSVKVRIKNYGTATETSIPLVFLRNMVQVGAGIWTGSLAPNDSVDYTFSTVNVSPQGNYNLCAKTVLSGDANTANDETCIYPVGITGIETYDYETFELLQNTPNPSDATTYVLFYVPQEGKVRFEMHDLLGRNMLGKDIEAVRGRNQIELDVNKLPEGIYFYSAEYKGQKLTKRMLVAK